MSTFGATVGRWATASARCSSRLLRSIAMMMCSLRRLDRDLARLGVDGLGQGHGEDAVLDRGGRLLRVDLGRQAEAAREAERAALLAMHRVALGRVGLALAGDGEHVLGQGERHVLVAETGNLGLEDDFLAAVED